jgi:hypothetical protein
MFIFQELNYDDLNWSKRQALLGDLQDMVEIVIVWSGGFQRSELPDAQYRKYWRFCLDAIDLRKSRGRRQ